MAVFALQALKSFSASHEGGGGGGGNLPVFRWVCVSDDPKL